MIAIGWVIYAAAYAGIPLANARAIWPLFAFYGLLGIFYLAQGITTIASSVVAGLLWDHVDPSAPFWFGAAGAVVALAILPLAARAARRMQKRQRR